MTEPNPSNADQNIRTYGNQDLDELMQWMESDDNNSSSQSFQNPTFGNPRQIQEWPVPYIPYTCTCCQTLREIFHVNGNFVHKLEVHGTLGMIAHAVLDVSDGQNHEYHMFDFCNESTLGVKQFLVKYCDDRKMQGFVILIDPLSPFYDALCVGLDSNPIILYPQQNTRGETVEINHMNQEETSHQHETNANVSEEAQNEVTPPTRSHYASQRLRTKTLRLKDLSKYFHLTIEKASKEIKLCTTSMKDIMRKGGLPRWPQRKVVSLQNRILKEETKLNSNNPDQRDRATKNIAQLQEELDKYYVYDDEGNLCQPFEKV